MNGKRGQECRDLGGAQLSRVALAVEEDVPLDPMDVGPLGATTVVSGADGLADLIEKARLWGVGPTGFAAEPAKRLGRLPARARNQGLRAPQRPAATRAS
jgi:hypothetical protein